MNITVNDIILFVLLGIQVLVTAISMLAILRMIKELKDTLTGKKSKSVFDYIKSAVSDLKDITGISDYSQVVDLIKQFTKENKKDEGANLDG